MRSEIENDVTQARRYELRPVASIEGIGHLAEPSSAGGEDELDLAGGGYKSPSRVMWGRMEPCGRLESGQWSTWETSGTMVRSMRRRSPAAVL